MSQGNSLSLEDSQAQIWDLRHELKLRDQLVQQLSTELLQLITAEQQPPLPSTQTQVLASDSEVALLHSQIQALENQLIASRLQATHRQQEIAYLQQIVEELRDRNQTLERTTQELPVTYRQKFCQRLASVKEKVAALQLENRQLQTELQTVSYQLALMTRQSRGEKPDLMLYALKQSESVSNNPNV